MKYGTEPLGKINELDNIGEEKDVFFLYKKKSKSFYWMIVHFNMYYLLYYKLQ